MNNRFIQIDEEGYFHFEGQRVTDKEFARDLFSHLRIDDFARVITSYEGEEIIVEAFDAPFVARQVYKKPGGKWDLLMPYEFQATFSLETLCLDEWDRFHGLTTSSVPFVFSRPAQAEFFNLLDAFDDDSITVDGRRIETGPWLIDNNETIKPEFWDEVYIKEEKPGWELGEPTPVLPQVLPQLKLPKMRVMVMGAGSGNDAAFFAQQGHIVTAVDMSAHAIEKAKEKYGHLPIRWVQCDLFQLGQEFRGQYDLIFEHTCYCAITPSRRNELVRKWKELLAPEGNLLGVFFVMEKRTGPPFGGSEWEVRERLKKDFDFLYWTRWKNSAGMRTGKELVVFAKKKGME